MQQKLILLLVLLSQLIPNGRLQAQFGPVLPANFCTPVGMEAFCGPGTTAERFDARYGIDPSCLSNTVFSFPTTEGTSNCVPEFGGYQVKLADDAFFDNINSERSAWNKDSDLAFFRGTNDSSLTFFDEFGDKLCTVPFKVTDFYNSYVQDWKGKMTTIRWHPHENAIFYPKEHQLIKRRVVLTQSGCYLAAPQVIASFNGYTIGMGTSYGNQYRIAGGDGNDVNAGRFLISLVRNGITYFVVYDFSEDKIVTQTVTTNSTNDILHAVSTTPTHAFTLPQLDYAQISASGLYIVANVKDGSTEEVRIYDLNGTAYQVNNGTSTNGYLLNSNSHLDVALVKPSQGQIRDAIIVRIIPSNTIGTDGGDKNAIYWYAQSGSLVLQTGQMNLLSWQTSAANLGGQQHSAIPGHHVEQGDAFTPYTLPADYSYRALTSMKEIDPYTDLPVPCTTATGGTPWKAYFGEIVELSLTYEDPQPRRIVHHRITTLNPTGNNVQKNLQPEAWFSPDGEKVFFKSPDINTPGLSDENLYFIDLPLRNCPTQRAALGSSYRLASSSLTTPAINLYPNPVNQGSIWLEADQPPEGKVMLRLLSVDGSLIDVWNGYLLPGVRQKVSVHELAAGMYVAELINQETGNAIQRQKLLIR